MRQIRPLWHGNFYREKGSRPMAWNTSNTIKGLIYNLHLLYLADAIPVGGKKAQK